MILTSVAKSSRENMRVWYYVDYYFSGKNKVGLKLTDCNKASNFTNKTDGLLLLIDIIHSK